MTTILIIILNIALIMLNIAFIIHTKQVRELECRINHQQSAMTRLIIDSLPPEKKQKISIIHEN